MKRVVLGFSKRRHKEEVHSEVPPCLQGCCLQGRRNFCPPVGAEPAPLLLCYLNVPKLSRTGHTLCPNQLAGHLREPSWKQKFVLKFPFCLSLPISPPCASLQTSDKTILYSVATTLVNCTNSYDVKEVIPELVQLAKFSKQHVPEEHPKVRMGTARDGVCATTPPERWKDSECRCCTYVWENWA